MSDLCVVAILLFLFRKNRRDQQDQYGEDRLGREHINSQFYRSFVSRVLAVEKLGQ